MGRLEHPLQLCNIKSVIRLRISRTVSEDTILVKPDSNQGLATGIIDVCQVAR